MKRLIVLVSILTIIACKQEPKDYVTISGKIENPAGKVISINGYNYIKEISLNEDGTFSDTLKIQSGYYSIGHGRETLTAYLVPTNDLSFVLNTKEFDESIKYEGSGATNNNYLTAKYLFNEQNATDFSVLYGKEQDSFLEEVEKQNKSNLDFLNNAENLSAGFIELEKKSIKYDYLLNLQQYPSYHEYFAKKEDVKVSEEFLTPLKDFDFSNENDYITFNSYKRLVQNHYAEKLTDSDDPTKIFNELRAMNSSVIKEGLSETLAYKISPNNEKNEVFFNGVVALSANNDFKEKLTKKYNKIKELVKGKPSPQFNNYENYKGGTTSLSDLKGKYIYIDVWATWCGPCKREIPFLKEVEKKYHGKNIEFVSTSIDVAKAHNTWAKMVKEKELSGIQLFADNDWKSQFVVDYAIEGIPRFILIDTNGNIVSADAPRPSSPALIELFDSLKI